MCTAQPFIQFSIFRVTILLCNITEHYISKSKHHSYIQEYKLKLHDALTQSLCSNCICHIYSILALLGLYICNIHYTQALCGLYICNIHYTQAMCGMYICNIHYTQTMCGLYICTHTLHPGHVWSVYM